MRALIYTAPVSRSRARRAAQCLGFTAGASLGLTSPPNNRRRKKEKRSAQANTAQQDNTNCTDQAELLHGFRRILNTKSIHPSAVYDAKKTLGTSSDYGASILPKFFETQPSYPHFMQNLERFGALNFLPASTFL